MSFIYSTIHTAAHTIKVHTQILNSCIKFWHGINNNDYGFVRLDILTCVRACTACVSAVVSYSDTVLKLSISPRRFVFVALPSFISPVEFRHIDVCFTRRTRTGQSTPVSNPVSFARMTQHIMCAATLGGCHRNIDIEQTNHFVVWHWPKSCYEQQINSEQTNIIIIYTTHTTHIRRCTMYNIVVYVMQP